MFFILETTQGQAVITHKNVQELGPQNPKSATQTSLPEVDIIYIARGYISSSRSLTFQTPRGPLPSWCETFKTQRLFIT